MRIKPLRIVALDDDQLRFFHRLLRMRSLTMSLASFASALMPGIGPRGAIVAIATVALVLPVNEWLRRRSADTWHGFPAVIPAFDLFGVCIATLLEPTLWGPGAMLALANLTVPVMLFTRRSSMTMAVVAVAAFGLAGFRASDVPRLSLFVGFAISVPLTLAALYWLTRSLQLKAQRDPLTGLANRDWLAAQMNEWFAGPATGIGLVLVDLNAFKRVNDSLGHAAGDELLVCIAQRLRAAAPSGSLVARLGGDEFAVVVRSVQSVSDCERIAEAISVRCAEPASVAGVMLRVHAATGVAVAPQHATDPETLMRRADLAMYAAKRGHRRSVTFAARDDEASERTSRLMIDFPGALAGDQIRPWVQPRVDLSTGAVAGVELLARWNHPDFGDVPPAEFIPIAAITGTSIELAVSMLHHAGLISQRWSGVSGAFDIAVNVAASDVMHSMLPDAVRMAWAEQHTANHRLVLEVTETQMMEHLSVIEDAVRRLSDLGALFSLDDFGVGHSSFARLRDLPVAELKLDRSFVSGLGPTSINLPILRSMIELGRNLGLTVIAEGIENRQELEWLMRLGCHQGQGYFLGRPMPVEQFELEWLASSGSSSNEPGSVPVLPRADARFVALGVGENPP